MHMTELPIGSLWRSRHNEGIRIILDVEVSGVWEGDHSQMWIEFYDSYVDRSMTTLASVSAWMYHWRLISK